MQVFWLFIYLLIGNIVERTQLIKARHISFAVIYIIAPILFFLAIAVKPIPNQGLILVFTITLSCIIGSTLLLLIARKLGLGKNSYQAAFSAFSGNTGYLGVPIALIVWGDEILPIAVLATLGTVLYTFSFGSYLLLRSSFSMKKSFIKLVTLPVLHAVVLAVIWGRVGLPLPHFFISITPLVKIIYSLFGLMIIGASLVPMPTCKNIDKVFLTVVLFGKFCLLPLLTIILIFFEGLFLGLLSQDFKNIILLYSFAPVGANVVALSFKFCSKENASKATHVVLVSTLFVFLSVCLFFIVE